MSEAPAITDEEMDDIERRARVNGNIRPSRALALVAEVRRLRSLNEAIAAVIDKELTYRDLEVKMRDGKLDVRAVLGDGSQPVGRFLAAMMLHWLLGEGQGEPHEPPNYLSGEVKVAPAGSFESLTCAMEVIKPGGKSSHKIREELAAENERLRSLLRRGRNLNVQARMAADAEMAWEDWLIDVREWLAELGPLIDPPQGARDDQGEAL